MTIQTKTGSAVEVSADKIYNFAHGIIGFEAFHKYAVIASDVEPFVWLQSTENKDLAFLLVDPFLVCPNYEANIDDELLKALGTKSACDLVVMTTVTISGDGKTISANLLGPIVLNKATKECAQAILSDDKWTTKFDILSSLESKGEQTKVTHEAHLETVGVK